MARGVREFFRGLLGRAGEDEHWPLIDTTPGSHFSGWARKWKAGGDLIAHPEYIWSDGYLRANAGLSEHFVQVAAAYGGRVLSDVLVILSKQDFRKSREDILNPWEARLTEHLDGAFSEMARKRSWLRIHPSRRLTVRVVEDGSAGVGGEDLELQPGEFATVLAPNLYHGPQEADEEGDASRKMLEIFVRMPSRLGTVTPPRHAGTLYSDQLAFTVGNHWLDNDPVMGLECSALYTVHRYPGQRVGHNLGSQMVELLHLEPFRDEEGRDIIQVREQGGTGVILEVMLVPAAGSQEAVEMEARRRQEEEVAASEVEGGVAETLPTLIPFDMGSVTVIPDPDPVPTLVLSERGFLLQKVHFPDSMLGYSVDVSPLGEVAPRLSQASARILVEGKDLYLVPLRADLLLDNLPQIQGRKIRLAKEEHRFAWGGSVEGTIKTLLRPEDKHWPYLAEIRTPPRPSSLPYGEGYIIGRDKRTSQIPLSDRPGQDNILWRPAAPGGEVKFQGGAMARVTTDAINVASRHAEIDLRGEEPLVRSVSEKCATYVRRSDGSVHRLRATSSGGDSLSLLAGDELLVGNSLFRALLPGQPSSPTREEPPSLRPRTRTQDLGSLVADPKDGSEPQGTLPRRDVEIQEIPAPPKEKPPQPAPPRPQEAKAPSTVEFLKGPQPAASDGWLPSPAPASPVPAPSPQPLPPSAPVPLVIETGPDEALPPLRLPDGVTRGPAPAPHRFPGWTEASTLMGDLPPLPRFSPSTPLKAERVEKVRVNPPPVVPPLAPGDLPEPGTTVQEALREREASLAPRALKNPSPRPLVLPDPSAPGADAEDLPTLADPGDHKD